MHVILFSLVLCVAIAADVYFTHPQRSEYYCLAGVVVLAYAVAKAFVTLSDEKQTPMGIIMGLVMAGAPVLIWSVPVIIKLPWMTEVIRSDGDGEEEGA